MPGSQQKTSCQPACLYREGLSSKFHKIACKKQLNKMPRNVWISDVLCFTMHQSMSAAEQTSLVLSESFPPSPASALADGCSL